MFTLILEIFKQMKKLQNYQVAIKQLTHKNINRIKYNKLSKSEYVIVEFPYFSLTSYLVSNQNQKSKGKVNCNHII